MKKASMFPFLFLLLMFIYGCTNNDVTSNSSDSSVQKIRELEMQIEELKRQNKELEKKAQDHLTESLAFSEISRKTSLFMSAIINTDMETIVALSEKDVSLFMKDKDIWVTYDEDMDLNLTHNAMNETLVSWFIEYIGFEPNTNQMQALVRPHYVDANNELVQEVDRYYQLIFSKVNDEWLISEIFK